MSFIGYVNVPVSQVKLNKIILWGGRIYYTLYAVPYGVMVILADQKYRRDEVFLGANAMVKVHITHLRQS